MLKFKALILSLLVTCWFVCSLEWILNHCQKQRISHPGKHENPGKWVSSFLVRQKSGNLGKVLQIREKSGNFVHLPKIESGLLLFHNQTKYPLNNIYWPWWLFGVEIRTLLSLAWWLCWIWRRYNLDYTKIQSKINEMNRASGHFCAHKLGLENLLRMVRWVRWHGPPDTGFEIQILEVWSRARYLSITETPHNIYVSFKLPRPVNEPRALAWKAAVLTTTLGPPPFRVKRSGVNLHCSKRNFENSSGKSQGKIREFCFHEMLVTLRIKRSYQPLCQVAGTTIYPFELQFTIVIFIHYKPWIAVAILDL